MVPVLLYSLRIFFMVLEGIMVVYVLRGVIIFLPYGPDLEEWIYTLSMPILAPMQHFMKRSILHTLQIDISPYILMLCTVFLQNVCSRLLEHCN